MREGLQFVLHEEDVEFLKLNAERLKPGPDGAVDLGTDAARWKSVYGVTGDYSGDLNAGGSIASGSAGSRRGVVTVWHGEGAQLPGALRLYSADGTAWHLFVENDGTVRIHNGLPVNELVGTPVGLQF